MKFDDRVAYLNMGVDPDGGLLPGYELKMNSYDLGVDIELADALRRIRFEHPEVGAVVIGSDLDRMFCAGANIGMLASATHALKVNFCKFTNETRNEIESSISCSTSSSEASFNSLIVSPGTESRPVRIWDLYQA